MGDDCTGFKTRLKTGAPLWKYTELVVVIIAVRKIAVVPDDGVLSFCASQGECRLTAVVRNELAMLLVISMYC